ncbi:A/G-specific adenine glycosylase [Carboxylicivirga taeanensis]|uniref:A/G-specific adenine glycosylase n=1 Tax=Carboxylicivirga taeanensis TaxID=1416875 RepID=UPI003F6E0210
MTDFGIKLLEWYHLNKRPLPWRSTTDPYRVWLSEIILQQTQVVQGTAYYMRFVNQFPDIKHLAQASEEQVLKLWQGLGYYSRARNLHATAQYIVSELKGDFPQSYPEILQLKGVGPYTAAAIASFCFNLPHAAVDGNVYRFLSRLKGIETAIDTTEGKKLFTQIAEDLLNHRHPGDHNQAMIEFGALMCKPVNPLCGECPFREDCMAFATGTITSLPKKSKKIRQRKRYFHYLFIEDEGQIYLEKREGDDVWKNLYQLPVIEAAKNIPIQQLVGAVVEVPILVNEYKHVLSHQIIYASFYVADKSVLEKLKGNYLGVPLKTVHKYPFPQLIANFLNERIGLKQD